MASKSLGTLTIDLIAKTGGFEQGMSRAERSAERGSREIERRLQRVDKAFDRIRIGVATTGVAIAGAVGAWVNSMSKSMDATLKMAQQIGTTTEALTGLRYAAQQFSNVSDQTFDMSLRRMTRRIAEAADGSGAAKNAIEALGLSAQSLAGLSVDEQFLRVADAMKGTADQGSRLRATMAIFDTEGMPLVNALSQGREELQKYTEEARRLGVVIDTDAALAAEKFQTSLTKMKASVEGLSISVGNQVLPVLAEFVEQASQAAEETDGVAASARSLAADNSLSEWINIAGLGFAHLIDVAIFLAKSIGVVANAFRVVAADSEVAVRALQKAQVWNWFDEDASRQLGEAMERRNQIVEASNLALVDLMEYDGDRFVQTWRDVVDRINFDRNFVGPVMPGGTLQPIRVSPSKSGGKDKTTELQALIRKLDEQRATLGMTTEQAERYRIETAKGTEADRARALVLFDQIQAWKEADKAIRQAAESSRYIAAINRELDVFQQQQNLTIAGIGMGDRQREQMERELAVRQDYAERRRQLEEAQQVESTRLSEDQYQRRIQALKDAEQRQIQILRDAAVLKAQAEGDWTNGAIRGLQNYSDEVANVADSVAQAVGSSFRGMEDAIVSFVRTGKADFRSLADSIISDLVRIAVQQSVTGPIAAWMGGLFASPAAPAGVTPGLDWTFASGGYTGDGGKYEPAGIVHRGEGVLNQEEISALGGESGFNALRRALRTGHAVGGMAGRPSLPPVGRGAPSVELNIVNQSGQPVGAGQPQVRMDDAGRLVIDVMLTDLRNNGPYARQLKGVLG